MSFYDVDYSNASDGQVTPGIYEVFVSDYQIMRAKSTGNVVVSLFYTLRDDVNQPYPGSKIQYDQFVEVATAKWRWDTAAKAAGIPDRTPIASALDWANLMINKDLKVKVAMSAPNNQGNSYPEVKEFYPTDIPSVNRPMPQLEKAYGQQQMNNAANSITQNHQQNYPNQSTHTPAATGVANNFSYQEPAMLPQNNAVSQNQNNFANPAYTQQTLAGTDPIGDNRSFANGGFRSTDISDDDLPF